MNLNLNTRKRKEEIVVFGVGKLGSAIIKNLYNLDKYFIIAIDEDQESLDEIKEFCNAAIQGDFTEEEFLENIGIENAKIFIVANGDNIQSSILVASILQDKFDGDIIVRAESRIHKNILKKLGITKIINPNIDSAQKISLEIEFPKKSSNLQDLEIVNFDERASFGKFTIPKEFVDKKVKDINIPKSILIALIVRDNFSKVVDGEAVLKENDIIYAVGDIKKLYKWFENLEL